MTAVANTSPVLAPPRPRRVSGRALTSRAPYVDAVSRERPPNARADRAEDVTPFLHLDLRVVVRRFDEISAALPGTAVHYPVRANPHPQVLRALVSAGAGFDVVSPIEIAACLDAGATPDQLLYSNPVKRRTDVRAAYELGIRLYGVDSMPEMLKLADEGPGASVLCRLATSGHGRTRRLVESAGCTPDSCVEILTAAGHLGLSVAGVSTDLGFLDVDNVGCGGRIAVAGEVFRRLEGRGMRPWLLDLGGELQGSLDSGHSSLNLHGDTLRRQLQATFGDDHPCTVIKPGRWLVGDAGVLHTTVIAVCWRGGRRWVHLDADISTGPVAAREPIPDRVTTDHDGTASGPVVLAGPTSDSADIRCERHPIHLPLALQEGDRLRFHGAGVHTARCSTFGPAAFSPLRTRLTGL
jgi:ornithine decarboxylase